MRALLLAAAAATFAVCVLAVACSAQTGAEPYGAEVLGASQNPGLDTWSYVVRNTSPSANYALWVFAITVDEETDVVDVTSPTGWIANTDQPHFISWICLGHVSAGDSVDGFLASYTGTPSLQEWTAVFENLGNPGETPVDYGAVTLAPEPGSVLVLATGLISLVRVMRRRAH